TGRRGTRWRRRVGTPSRAGSAAGRAGRQKTGRQQSSCRERTAPGRFLSHDTPSRGRHIL
ncbi:MAG: hypothetical protein J7474_04975, partial [Arthrobacter sp.]|nr:hypothetical protein [Arthrobacter sp.]